MSEWQPIETAPRDGTEVLVGKDIATVWIVRNARWVNANDWVPPENDEVDGWWAYRNSVTQELLEGIFEPTHWIPMPQPPADVG